MRAHIRSDNYEFFKHNLLKNQFYYIIAMSGPLEKRAPLDSLRAGYHLDDESLTISFLFSIQKLDTLIYGVYKERDVFGFG